MRDGHDCSMRTLRAMAEDREFGLAFGASVLYCPSGERGASVWLPVTEVPPADRPAGIRRLQTSISTSLPLQTLV